MRCSSTLLLPKLFAKTLNVSKYECYPFGNVHNQPLLVQKLSTFSQEVSFNGLSKFRPFLKLSSLFFERIAMYYLFWPWSRCLKNDGRLAEFFCMHDCTLDYDPHLQLPLDIVVRPRHWAWGRSSCVWRFRLSFMLPTLCYHCHNNKHRNALFVKGLFFFLCHKSYNRDICILL